MSKRCDVCGKGPVSGSTIARRGLAKKKGGVGQNTTGVTLRRFMPNLQNAKVDMNGEVKTIKVCTRCLKAGKVKKAS